jgi:hypothetical protein
MEFRFVRPPPLMFVYSQYTKFRVAWAEWRNCTTDFGLGHLTPSWMDAEAEVYKIKPDICGPIEDRDRP